MTSGSGAAGPGAHHNGHMDTIDSDLDRYAVSEEPAKDPDPTALTLFWAESSKVIGLTSLDVVVGSNSTALVPPPAWQLGLTAREATELAARIVAGTKTATSSSKADYDEADEPLPQVNTLGIVCDGAGRPVALVRTDAVDIVPFDAVDEEWAVDEGEADLASWRRDHLRLLANATQDGTDGDWPQDPMVLERLTCLFPQLSRGSEEPIG